MLTIGLDKKDDSVLRVLCLGAHCDDIEIGCGGTILKLIGSGTDIEFFWIVLSSDQRRAREATKSADILLQNATAKRVVVQDFRERFFPYIGVEIKEYFDQLKQEFSPDLVFTHYGKDMHQDHRLISELTWNTFRDHLILEYEIPKYDGDLGSPNLFVPLSESLCQRKARHIQDTFRTQAENHWFSEETFLSILRLRGVESNAPSGYAEAFYCRKIILG